MKFYRNTSSVPDPPPRTVLTIGNFDGLHRGHQMILREVVARARAIQGTSVLLTFDPSPSRVLGKGNAPLISTLEDRAALAAALGVDLFIVQEFTTELAAMTPLEFVQSLLETSLDPCVVIIGYDFCFGRDRSGDFQFLERYFTPKGGEVLQLGPLTLGAASQADEEIISSSAIRRHILAGDVARAALMLGRPHFIRGEVVRGDALGRTLGFPTANLASLNELLPKSGVYATRMHLGERSLDGVSNLGVRPTVGGTRPGIETHLFDFSGEIYGARVQLEFIARLRAEQRFPGLDALQAQIALDVAAAREILRSDASGGGLQGGAR